jgi:hypothetical protein
MRPLTFSARRNGDKFLACLGEFYQYKFRPAHDGRKGGYAPRTSRTSSLQSSMTSNSWLTVPLAPHSAPMEQWPCGRRRPLFAGCQSKRRLDNLRRLHGCYWARYNSEGIQKMPPGLRHLVSCSARQDGHAGRVSDSLGSSTPEAALPESERTTRSNEWRILSWFGHTFYRSVRCPLRLHARHSRDGP